MIQIINEGDTILIQTDDVLYTVGHSPHSGDWLVTGENDETMQGEWMLDKDSAMQYALMKAGVLDDPDYDRAPDRC